MPCAVQFCSIAGSVIGALCLSAGVGIGVDVGASIVKYMLPLLVARAQFPSLVPLNVGDTLTVTYFPSSSISMSSIFR